MKPTNLEVAHKLTKARAALIMDQPFFGTLALRLILVERFDIPTLAVDGKHIFYNPDFIAKLELPLVKSAVAHEVMHCVLDHVTRRGDRDPEGWNIAGDYVGNAILKDAGFQLGDGWLYDPQYNGMTTDHVYSLLPKTGGKGGGGSAPPGTSSDSFWTPDSPNGPLCDVMQTPFDDRELEAQDWKVATIQAANAAKAQGRLTGALQRFVDEITDTKVDWKEQLRRFITERSKEDYSWTHANRHFLSQGIYIPSLYSETMGEVVIVIDTSGSIDDPTLKAFASEIEAIRDNARPARTHVIYCDCSIDHVAEFEVNDLFRIETHGGGGTDFRPPFEYVNEHSIRPACLVYLTDLYGSWPDHPPEYPVMWVCTTDRECSWGETLRIEV